jgi:4,5-dihydroxyphthalate decarboxylase
MAKLALTLSCGDYDRTRALIDGRVQPEDVDLTVLPLPPGDRHARFIRGGEFDACDVNLGVYLAWKAVGGPCTAIPVFPDRRFCHGNLLVSAAAGILQPDDLVGQPIGIRTYCSPIAIWVRGLLADEHGLTPDRLAVAVAADEQIPGWTPPADMPIQRLPPGARPDALLAAGQLGAYVPPEPPPDRPPAGPIARLWPDYRARERDYYRRTGIFPIMHTVVLRDAILQREPWVASSLLAAFATAQQLALADLAANPRASSLAWFAAELEEELQLFGPTFWACGVEPNRAAIDALTRYAYQQRVTPRQLTPAELFVPAG